MMQDYDFQESLQGVSTNTSSKSVSNTLLPSRRVLQNIQHYARHANCFQHVRFREVEIKVSLN